MKTLRAWLGGVLLACTLAWAGAAVAQAVERSSAERAWLQANPALRLGVAQE